MIIPKLHYISQGNSPKEHLENIQKACTSGIELVRLGLTNVSEKKTLKIANEAREITSHFQVRLIINDHYKLAKEVKADGVYLERTDSYSTKAKKQLYTWQIIGATANTLQDCESLIAKKVDYIGLGPFRLAAPEDNINTVLGINGYIAILEALKTEIPIIAFGGITTEDGTNLLKTGISGIAVSSEITRDFNTISTFNKLLNPAATEEQRYTFK